MPIFHSSFWAVKPGFSIRLFPQSSCDVRIHKFKASVSPCIPDSADSVEIWRDRGPIRRYQLQLAFLIGVPGPCTNLCPLLSCHGLPVQSPPFDSYLNEGLEPYGSILGGRLLPVFSIVPLCEIFSNVNLKTNLVYLQFHVSHMHSQD